jgi:hypothetical protein
MSKIEILGRAAYFALGFVVGVAVVAFPFL